MTWYVVDGMDGSGKSTVAGEIADRLRSHGRRVMLIGHPNRDTALGRLELRFLQGDSKLDVILSTLLYIADVLHSLSMMKGRRGRAYDDFVFVRYSMAAAYLSDGSYRKAYAAIEVLVDVDPDTAIRRIMGRGESLEVFETVERLGTVRRRMLDLSEDWIVLDNSGDPDDLRARIDGILPLRRD